MYVCVCVCVVLFIYWLCRVFMLPALSLVAVNRGC